MRRRAGGARARGAAHRPPRAEVQPHAARPGAASAYLKLDPSEAFPRLKVVYASKPADGCLYLGPFGTSARARLAKEALEEVVPIRRCTQTMRAATRFAPCALADMGRCPAPCDGRIDPERYGELVGGLVSSLTASPGELLGALESRMSRLADQGRYEEAALVRDRLRALAEALARRRQDAWLVGARDLRLTTQDGLRARFHAAARSYPGRGTRPASPLSLPCPRERADELAAVRSWLTAQPPADQRRQRPVARRARGRRCRRRTDPRRTAEGRRSRARRAATRRGRDAPARLTDMDTGRHPRGRADADRQVPGIVRRRRPRSSWARSPPSRRSAGRGSSPTRSIRPSSAMPGRPGTARTPADR